MPLDQAAVKAHQKELEERSSGSKNFIKLKTDVEQLDIRVLDPSPAMKGNWFIEVPIWWIGKHRITDPKFLDKSDNTIENILTEIEQEFAQSGETEEAREKSIAEFKALRHKTGGKYNTELIRKEVEYWVPVLQFEWEFDKSQEIIGIYDDKGEIDVNLVSKFIVDGQAKIFSGKISVIKAINKVVTTRGGYSMVECEGGFNLSVSRSGKDRDTTYGAVKTEDMPMPTNFYGTGTKSLDPVKLAKSSMLTTKYIDAVLSNYFYGEAIPEKPEFEFPELRESKSDEEKPQQSSRRRSGNTEETSEEPATEKSAGRGRGTSKAAPARGRGVTKERNLLEDVKEGDE